MLGRTFSHMLAISRHAAATVAIGCVCSVWAAEVCEMVFTSCPENFDGDTITVSDDVVALSAEILACEPTAVEEGIDTTVIDSGGPPSVFFIIDHSGSMTGTGTPCNDQWGSRFTVAAALLDTIAALHPDAEIGVAVFNEYLYFDDKSSEYFARHFQRMSTTYDSRPRQSYLPLMQLDRNYQGKTGLQILRDVLAVDTATGADDPRCDGSNKYLDLIYKPDFQNQNYTNINIGFLAAQEAFNNAQHAKNRQFIIFFSDGEPAGSHFADLDQFWFSEGNDVPTTFTVFFTPESGDQAPQSLRTMTRNIQQNEYSTSNPASELWTIQTTHQALLDLLTEQVLGYLVEQATIVSTGVPTAMLIGDKSNTSKTDTTFLFSERFALTGETTTFTMRIDYEYTNQKTQEKRDSSITVTFHVKRESGATLTGGVDKRCWTQPSLDLLYEGTSLVNDTAHEHMQQLVVHLSPNDEQMSSASVTVGTSLETEGFSLSLENDVWIREFLRLVATSATVDDKKLQHRAADSIEVVWRNPRLPLDTVRIVVPFRVSRSLAVTSAEYHDIDADGYIDSIYVNMGADLFAGDLDQLKPLITLPSERSFSNIRYVETPGGFAVLVDESTGNEPRTDVNENDFIKVDGGIFTHGGLVLESDVQISDRMAPVIISAVVVTGDTLGDTLKVEFSEPVSEITFNQPFNFKSLTGELYAVTVDELAQSNERYFFRVKEFTVVEDQQPGDTIWINPDGQVLDIRGNKQANPNNRRVRLDVKQNPYDVIPNVSFNPFDYTMGQSQLSPRQSQAISYVSQVYSTQGTPMPAEHGPIVTVEPQGKLRRSTQLSGTITVFDVVKNILVEDHPMAFDQNTKRLVYMWDGRNKSGKKVATGTYVAVIKISDNYGMKETTTVRIGVKR